MRKPLNCFTFLTHLASHFSLHLADFSILQPAPDRLPPVSGSPSPFHYLNCNIGRLSRRQRPGQDVSRKDVLHPHEVVGSKTSDPKFDQVRLPLLVDLGEVDQIEYTIDFVLRYG